MNLSDRKAQLLVQIRQIELLESALQHNKNIKEHNKSFTFTDNGEVVTTLENNDQLKVTKNMIIKIRLNDTDTFINYADFLTLDKHNLIKLKNACKDLEFEKIMNEDMTQYHIDRIVNYFITSLQSEINR